MSAQGDLAHPTLKLQDRSGLVGEAEDEAVELIECMFKIPLLLRL